MIRSQTLRLTAVLTLALAATAATTANAAVPALSSRPGAAYTVYMDFGGFAFSGNWGNNASYKPGTTAAYSGSTDQVQNVWARVAEKYSAFNVNVTTVDPAVTAGQSGTDLLRQNYYDAHAKLMHTVIGGNGSWTGGGGVSYLGVTQNAQAGSNGYHTDWVFAEESPSDVQFIGEAVTHENGHGFTLNHEGDSGIVNAPNSEYSSNNGASGNGSYAPIMGDSYGVQRGTWRTGNYYNSGNGVTTTQNDVQSMLSNSGMTLADDGIAHSFVSATALPLTGTSVDATHATGTIKPASSSTPTPIRINNYTKDYFKFTLGSASTITLNLADGGEWVTPSVTAAGATLRSKLNIYQSGNLITPFAVATEAGDTLSESYTGALAAGDYYAEITSFGGYASTFDPNAKYFDMGSYVLSGTSITGPAVVPEPTTLALVALGIAGFAIRRRAKNAG